MNRRRPAVLKLETALRERTREAGNMQWSCWVLSLLFKDCINILIFSFCFCISLISSPYKNSSVSLAANQGLATLAFFGVGVNLVLFLTRVLGQDNASAANNVSKWTGTVYLFSLVGAFLSDSYWGRYLTCAVFQLFFVLVLQISLSLCIFM